MTPEDIRKRAEEIYRGLKCSDIGECDIHGDFKEDLEFIESALTKVWNEAIERSAITCVEVNKLYCECGLVVKNKLSKHIRSLSSPRKRNRRWN